MMHFPYVEKIAGGPTTPRIRTIMYASWSDILGTWRVFPGGDMVRTTIAAVYVQ